MNINNKIFVAGHNGMVGSAIVRKLKEKGCTNIVTRTRKDLDLTNQQEVNKFLKKEKPDNVYFAAAKVGGIQANNSYPADFIYQNLMMECNVIHASAQNDVKRLLFLGSSCIYPKFAKQPISEFMLLDGKLEPTNEPYAIAKIAGIKLCESYNRQYGTDFRSVMPTNLYGPGDNYHSENSHVIPALIRRFHEAKISNVDTVTIWGSGKPRREFLFVDDLADACLHIMKLDQNYLHEKVQGQLSHINIGYGQDIEITELAEAIKQVVGYSGDLKYDTSKPDGTPKKLMDNSIIKELGWSPLVSLGEGLVRTYRDFTNNNNYRSK